MLSISINNNACTLAFDQYSFEFSKTFLTPPLWRVLSRLQQIYPLNHQESTEIEKIFTKIHHESSSSYLFTDALQRTYLVELIHFILKLRKCRH